MRKYFVVIIITVSTVFIFAQENSIIFRWAKSHRGTSLYTRFGLLNGNRTAITYSNDGSIAGTNPSDLRGYWPYPATQDGYIGDVTPLLELNSRSVIIMGMEYLIHCIQLQSQQVRVQDRQQRLTPSTDTFRDSLLNQGMLMQIRIP